MNVQQILNMRELLLNSGARIFIFTKTDHYEITSDTWCFNGKIWDDNWKVKVKDVEYIKLV